MEKAAGTATTRVDATMRADATTMRVDARTTDMATSATTMSMVATDIATAIITTNKPKKAAP